MIVSSPLSFCCIKPISKNAHKNNEKHKTNKKCNIFQRGSKRQIGNVSAHSFWRINRFLFETQLQRLQSKRNESNYLKNISGTGVKFKMFWREFKQQLAR